MPIGTPFTQLADVDSTNNYAIRMVQAQLAEHGETWFAHTQTAGKGQRSKRWQSTPGENIILSTVIDPYPLQHHQHFVLVAAVALGCFDFFSQLTNGDVTIKWPNDIYWRDRKAGGILIESIVRGAQWRYAVAGIGLNINQVTFPPELRNPVSLRQITGKTHDPLELARSLCLCLETRWQKVSAGEHEALLNDYNIVLYKRGQQVQFGFKNATFTAVVKAVSASGELVVDRGELQHFAHGAIEWLL